MLMAKIADSSGLIRELSRNHDDKPVEAAATLRELAEMEIDDRDLRSYGWLVNHVVGERLHRWDEALDLLRTVSLKSGNASIYRGVAIAALMNDRAVDAQSAQSAISRITGANSVDVALYVSSGSLQYRVSSEGWESLLPDLSDLLDGIQVREAASVFEREYAASLNNIVSAFLDKARGTDFNDAMKDSLIRAATVCRNLWYKAGSWINAERAEYLVALVCNRVGDWQGAVTAARTGLDIISVNGEETVDRAFLLLELGCGCRELGLMQDSVHAGQEAFLIAAGFLDPELRKWFDSCAAVAGMQEHDTGSRGGSVQGALS
jgi:hypothetical protein